MWRSFIVLFSTSYYLLSFTVSEVCKSILLFRKYIQSSISFLQLYYHVHELTGLQKVEQSLKSQSLDGKGRNTFQSMWSEVTVLNHQAMNFYLSSKCLPTKIQGDLPFKITWIIRTLEMQFCYSHCPG